MRMCNYNLTPHVFMVYKKTFEYPFERWEAGISLKILAEWRMFVLKEMVWLSNLRMDIKWALSKARSFSRLCSGINTKAAVPFKTGSHAREIVRWKYNVVKELGHFFNA